MNGSEEDITSYLYPGIVKGFETDAVAASKTATVMFFDNVANKNFQTTFEYRVIAA